MAMSERSTRTDEMAIDLGALWGAFWRARFWLVPLLVVVAAVAYAGLSSLPPKFRAEAKILIEARGSRIDAGQRDPEAERTLLDAEGVTSQVQLISSRDLARRVVQREKLDAVAEFRKGPGLIQTLLPFLKRASAVSPEQQVLDAYFERLTVYAIEKSRVITVEFVAGDPDVAARVANALVREYLSVQGEAKVTTSTDASSWLESEINGLRGKVAEAEAKVEQWRASHDLFATTRDGSLVDQQLSGLSTQLTAARTEKAGIEARVDQLRKVIASGPLDASADLQTSSSYQRLRERETLLRSRLAELSATLLSGHPQIRALNAQLADIQTQQRAEARRVLAALESEVKVADQRLRDLRVDVGDGKATAARANENDIQLRAFEREAKAQRDLLETFLARYREAIARQNDRALPPDARAISEASPPSGAFFPKVLPLTFLVTFAVFMIVTAFIILRELVSGRAVRPTWQPVATAPVTNVAAPGGAPTSGVGDPGDPDDPGPGGRRSARDTQPNPEPTPSAPAALTLATSGGEAPTADIAARQARDLHEHDLHEPDEIAWAATDELVADDTAMSPAPIEDTAEAAPAPNGQANGRRAAALPTLADVLGDVFQSGSSLLAVVTPVTAAHSRETALAAARRAAGFGRVCLVEWASQDTPLAAGPGLADLLAGRAGFDAIIDHDAASDVHVVPVGAGGLTPEMLADPALTLVIDALASCYDRIVVDAGLFGDDRPELVERLFGVDTVIVAIGPHEALAGERLRLGLCAAGLTDVVLAAAPVSAPDGVAEARDAA